jgi:hypothetical protein
MFDVEQIESVTSCSHQHRTNRNSGAIALGWKSRSWGHEPLLPDCNFPSVEQPKLAARAGFFWNLVGQKEITTKKFIRATNLT